MRVATVDGLVTLFYDGTKELYNHTRQLNLAVALKTGVESYETLNLSNECKRYIKERLSWQQVIVVEGVTEIPERTFSLCCNIKRVILADTVNRIQRWAFIGCKNLVFIKWSLRLELIGWAAFRGCNLSSVFIPPRCREIGDESFSQNKNLTILNVSQDTELGTGIINHTELHERYSQLNDGPLNTWLENINHNDQFDLHRVCSSFEPTLDTILNTVIEKGGLSAFKVENSIGISPSRYLKDNPYAHVTEMEIIEKYFLKMMGEL